MRVGRNWGRQLASGRVVGSRGGWKINNNRKPADPSHLDSAHCVCLSLCAGGCASALERGRTAVCSEQCAVCSVRTAVCGRTLSVLPRVDSVQCSLCIVRLVCSGRSGHSQLWTVRGRRRRPHASPQHHSSSIGNWPHQFPAGQPHRLSPRRRPLAGKQSGAHGDPRAGHFRPGALPRGRAAERRGAERPSGQPTRLEWRTFSLFSLGRPNVARPQLARRRERGAPARARMSEDDRWRLGEQPSRKGLLVGWPVSWGAGAAGGSSTVNSCACKSSQPITLGLTCCAPSGGASLRRSTLAAKLVSGRRVAGELARLASCFRAAQFGHTCAKFAPGFLLGPSCWRPSASPKQLGQRLAAGGPTWRFGAQ